LSPSSTGKEEKEGKNETDHHHQHGHEDEDEKKKEGASIPTTYFRKLYYILIWGRVYTNKTSRK
jgi:hypothetical protein